MKLLIDRKSIQLAVLITSTGEFGDIRRYYELRGADYQPALIVCRQNLALEQLAELVVDANVGWDTAMPGFTTDEHLIGSRRSKITIYRILRGKRHYDETLFGLLTNEQSL